MLLCSHSFLVSVCVLTLLLFSAVNGKLSSPRGLTDTEPNTKAASNSDDDQELEIATHSSSNDDLLFTPAASLDVFKNVSIIRHTTDV